VGNPRISPRHYEEMTDAELVAAAREGDRDAFATLVERHHAALLRACHGSADAAQESVLIAMTSLAALRDDAAFGPWLRGIGRNLRRREQTLDQGSDPYLRVEPRTQPSTTLKGSDPLLRARLLAAVAALPAGQRDAVALLYLADLSHAQIADRLGISVGAVKTRLHKARASLQTRLADLRREPPTMPAVPMRVADVRAAGDLHVVLLEERDGARRLPIWIGGPEATTLAARLHDVEPPRPGTYRFAAELLAAAGSGLEEVRIVRLADTVFFAEARLRDGSAVDARPSDALNLALVTGAPILVDEPVLAQAAEGEREIADELARALASDRDARAIAADERDRIAALPYGPEDLPRA
jgi:RNA polymerase sigma factor (sigma-70 family)